MQANKPLVLIIIDGFGISPDKLGSPWEAAEHPTFSEIEKFYPFTALQASGIAVGLPWGEAGNSEVGHLALGSGKIINNYLPKITSSISDGSFFENPALVKAVGHIKGSDSALHIMGIFSTGTVHAYYQHLYALLDFAKQKEVKNVYLHLFTDGKDAPKKEGAKFFENFEKYLAKNYPGIKIASVIGRSFPMDRNANWDKTEKAYNLFVKGEGESAVSPSEHIKKQYEKDIFDVAIEPAIIIEADLEASPPSGGEASKCKGQIKDGDSVIFFNFREDSARQLTRAFVEENFSGFKREKFKNLFFVTMTEYDKSLPATAAFKSAEVDHPLARIVADAGMNQLHIAESEKYAHITYFLNGGKEEPFANESRILIPSPEVNSYDEMPEMSSAKVKEAILSGLEKNDFVAVNFANADMVGHTGDFEATAKALSAIDKCISEIMAAVLKLNGTLIITADHGNAEEKLYKITGEKKTEHSTNPVPFYLISNEFRSVKEKTQPEIKKSYADVKGALSDVAPTILELLNLKKPVEMTGESLLGKLI